MKRTLTLLLTAIMILVIFVGCAQISNDASDTSADPNNATPETNSIDSAESSDEFLLGVSFPFLNDPYFVIMRDTFVREADARGWTLTESDAASDPAKQANAIDNMISAGCDAIVICAVDSEAIVPSIKNCNDAGIPVFTIDVKCSTTENEKVEFHIETNNYQGGQIVGEWLVDYLGGEGKIAIGNYPQIECCRMRYDGFVDALEGSNIEIVAEQRGCSVDEGMKIGEAWAASIAKEIDAVYCTDDNTAYGIMTAFLNNDIEDVVFCAVDGQQMSQQAMIDGKPFGCSGAQRPRLMAELEMEAIDRYLEGGTLPEIVQIPVVNITPENAASIDIPGNTGYPPFSIDWSQYD